MPNIYKLGMISIALGLALSPPGSAQCKYDPVCRVKDAQDLLAQTKKYCQSSQRLHAQVEKTIEIAQTLKGHATDLEIKVNETVLAPHLKGVQLKAAQGQFASDLKSFKAHADEYAAHVQQFRRTVGECKANAAQYAAEVRRYELHTEVFHIPNIRPPHICGELNMSQGEASHIANQMASDQGRLMRAEQMLADAQTKLNATMAVVPGLQGQVLNENRRAREEKLLLQEFSRLKAEYDTLAVEHAALVGRNMRGTISSKTVSGKIKNSKTQ